MRRVSGLLLFLTIVPLALAAQRLRGEGEYYRYGYDYSPWQETNYQAIQFRTKCEGEQVRGTNTGPIKWVIEYHNRAQFPVHFDYVIEAPGKTHGVAATGRQDIKSGKNAQKFTVVQTTRCDDGITITIGNVRFGDDINGTPYAQPERH